MSRWEAGRAVDQRDEREIETRLRAALTARGEQVTHQTLRPAAVPGTRAAESVSRSQATAGGAGWRGRNLSWRSFLVPAMVTAALAGGVFVGMAMPGRGSGGSPAITADSGVGASAVRTPAGTVPTPTPQATATAIGSGTVFDAVSFDPGTWKLTKVSDTVACVAPAAHAAPNPAAELPCGADALMIKTDATAGTWPLNSVQDKAGWWPVKGAILGDIQSPAALMPPPGITVPTTPTTPTTTTTPTAAGVASAASAADASTASTVVTSATFRRDDAYLLKDGTKAGYEEWSVTLSDKTGLRPMLWRLPDGKTVLTAVSASARDEPALLAIVQSVHVGT